MAGSIYLADTTVFVVQGREQSINRRFVSLLSEGRLAACQMSAMEYLNNAPDPRGYQTVWGALRAMRWMDVTTQVMDRALEVHRKLGATSQHRHFSLPTNPLCEESVLCHAEREGSVLCRTTSESLEYPASPQSRQHPQPLR